jgi:hypothetical protein
MHRIPDRTCVTVDYSFGTHVAIDAGLLSGM